MKRKLTKKEMKEKLKNGLLDIIERQKTPSDIEFDHSLADKLLIEYINDPCITNLFNKVEKYYA